MDKRDEFVTFLGEAMQNAKMHGTLIFDNNPKDAVLYPHRSSLESLEIIYAPNRLSADDYILEYIEVSPRKKTLLLVTSDNELSFKANNLGVKILSIADFFLLLTNRTKKGIVKEKPSTEGSRQIARYLALFEKNREIG